MRALWWTEIESREMVPGYRGRFLHTGNMTVAYWEVSAGKVLPEHAHPHEQVTNIITGRFEMLVDGHAQILGPGAVVLIPPDTVHAGRSLEDCVIIDVFCPQRDDYIC